MISILDDFCSISIGFLDLRRRYDNAESDARLCLWIKILMQLDYFLLMANIRTGWFFFITPRPTHFKTIWQCGVGSEIVYIWIMTLWRSWSTSYCRLTSIRKYYNVITWSVYSLQCFTTFTPAQVDLCISLRSQHAAFTYTSFLRPPV